MCVVEPPKVLINGVVFIVVTNTTTNADTVFNHEEAVAYTNGSIIATSR